MASSACLYRVQVQTDGGQCVEFCGTFNELRKLITDPMLIQQLEGQVEDQQANAAAAAAAATTAAEANDDISLTSNVDVELVTDDSRELTEYQDDGAALTADALSNGDVFAVDHGAAEAVSATGVDGGSGNGNSLIANLPDGVTADVTGFQWPRRAVLQLIKLFVESVPLFESPAFTQKQVWKIIADRLNSTEGFVVTPLQVDTKWRGLKKTYKKVKEHNAVASNAPRKWEFYSMMEEILERQEAQAVNDRAPLVTFDGSTGLQLTIGDVSTPVTATDSRLTSAAVTRSPFVKRRRITQQDNVNSDERTTPTTSSHDDDQSPIQQPGTATTSAAGHRRTAKWQQTELVPDWIALLREDLEERRKIRQEERNKIVNLLDKIADKL